MAKGFSLFTPIVGTGVMLVTILIVAVMIQNDVRVSRSIGTGYDIAKNSLDARLIKSNAELKIIQNLDEMIYEHLGAGQPIIAECQEGNQDCINSLEDYLIEPGSNLMTDINTISPYRGVIESIKSSTGYQPSLDECPYAYIAARKADDACLSEALDKLLSAGPPYLITLAFDEGSEKLIAKLDASVILESPEVLEIFTLDFENQNSGVSVKLLIVPFSFTMSTSENIKEMITKTAELFEEMRGKDQSGIRAQYASSSALSAILSKPALWHNFSKAEAYSSEGLVKLRTSWELKHNKVFKIEIREEGYSEAVPFTPCTYSKLEGIKC